MAVSGYAGGLFDVGPPAKLETLAGLMSARHPNIALRATLAICAGWLPLALIAAAQTLLLHDHSLESFAADYGLHARSLIAAPLLIVADGLCAPRLSAVAMYFQTARLIPPAEEPDFVEIVRSTFRLRDSSALEIALIGLVAAIVFLLTSRVPLGDLAEWQIAGALGTPMRSIAGWWHNLVTVPIFLMLLFGWVWRLGLWGRFLYLTSRLKLQLIAAHPDRSGGLGFLNIAVLAFALLGFSLNTLVAGAVANRVMHDGASLLSFRYAVLAGEFILLAIFLGPLLFFAAPLSAAWRSGVLKYGALARDVGMELERKWFSALPGPEALQVQDFSATTDLYAITSNAFEIRTLPVDFRRIAVLVVATLLPYVPVVLMSVPLKELMKRIAGVLL
jgi:hypothetical protein